MKLGSALPRTERVWILRLASGPCRVSYDAPAVRRLLGRGLASEERRPIGRGAHGPMVARIVTITPSGMSVAKAL